jgi:hypothetical protein
MTLDLRENLIQVLHLNTLSRLPNLKVLRLTRNPVKELFGVEKAVVSKVPYLEQLDLSHTQLWSIGPGGFQGLVHLQQLDLRGSHFEHFSHDLLQNLTELKEVLTSNYRLCCPGILPDNAPITCSVDTISMSPCENLLKVKFYQVTLIVIGLVAVLGNAACVPIRLAVHKESMDSSFSILVTNLNAANLLMGVYCGIIAGADQVFRGNFLNNEKAWTNSVACHLAGFLYLLSSDVSAFTIAVITWGQVTQILSALRDLRCCQRLGKRSSIIACLLVWAVTSTLTASFLFPPGFQWATYRRSVLCVPSPAALDGEHGAYSVVTHAVIRPVTLLLVSVGQAWLYRRVHTHTSSLTTADPDAHRLARQFTLVAVTDCVCWAVVSGVTL